MSQSRRRFIRNASLGVLTFQFAGCDREMTPADAHRVGVTLQALTEKEASTLEALAEVLLPGSAALGAVEYVDHQLGAPLAEQMLMIKYLGVNPPFLGFYQGGLAALEAASQAAHGAGFAELPNDQRQALVAAMAQDKIDSWAGPPGSFFYFVVRSDVVDVTYGTKAGMEGLGVPYMAHIEPPSPWGT